MGIRWKVEKRNDKINVSLKTPDDKRNLPTGISGELKRLWKGSGIG